MLNQSGTTTAELAAEIEAFEGKPWFLCQLPRHLAAEYHARVEERRTRPLRGALWFRIGWNAATLVAGVHSGAVLWSRGLAVRFLLLTALALALTCLIQRRLPRRIRALGAVLCTAIMPLGGIIPAAFGRPGPAGHPVGALATAVFCMNLGTPLSTFHLALAVSLQILFCDLVISGRAGIIPFPLAPEVPFPLLFMMALSVMARAWIENSAQRRFVLEELNREQKKELAAANERLTQLSQTDPLTGARNRRFLESEFSRIWDAKGETAASLAVIMVDIDHFKALNDTAGHQFGDQCLRQVAEALMANVRRGRDTVARYGGEEFALVLPGIEAADARAAAERIRQSVQDLRIPGPKGPLTVSAGGVWTEAANREVVRLADQALYQAKANGRNQVVWSGDAPAAAFLSPRLCTASSDLRETRYAGNNR